MLALGHENTAAHGTPAEEHLSIKQQYLKMIEQYPLVKELKDKLKLELDY